MNDFIRFVELQYKIVTLDECIVKHDRKEQMNQAHETKKWPRILGDYLKRWRRKFGMLIDGAEKKTSERTPVGANERRIIRLRENESQQPTPKQRSRSEEVKLRNDLEKYAG